MLGKIKRWCGRLLVPEVERDLPLTPMEKVAAGVAILAPLLALFAIGSFFDAVIRHLRT